VIKTILGICAMLVATLVLQGGEIAPQLAIENAKQAFEAGDYVKAAGLLEPVAAAEPQNGEVHLWLAQIYYQMERFDLAVSSAERAVASDPKNSRYHEWLGRALGDKADRSSFMSALGIAKRARREFEAAVQLDERNFAAFQALVEYDCSAPGIAGGGEDKARPEIARIAALDATEGHYALGNCRRQKKDFATADSEFTKALEGHPNSPDLIYDIGDYAMRRGQTERLERVIAEGERVAPEDLRGNFYRAVYMTLRTEKLDEADALLRDYLKKAPVRNNYPRPGIAHLWLGKIADARGNRAAATREYQTAVKMEPKNKFVQEALKNAKKAE
jgi:tetratricopeptide (TPR) repeat protein